MVHTNMAVSVYRNRILPPTFKLTPPAPSSQPAPATILTSWHINDDRLPNKTHPLSSRRTQTKQNSSSKTKRNSSSPSNIHPQGRREQQEGGWAHNSHCRAVPIQTLLLLRPTPPQPRSRNDDAHACMLPLIAPTSPAATHRLLTPQPSIQSM